MRSGRRPANGCSRRPCRSGRVYRTPVNLFRPDGRWVIALTYGSDSQWVRNVMAAGECEVETRGKRIRLVEPRIRDDQHRTPVPPLIRPILRLVDVSEFMTLRRDA